MTGPRVRREETKTMRHTLRAAGAALAVLTLGAAAGAQTPAAAPGEGPIDISADRGEVFDREGRLVYEGDVNVIRGATRLRADRIEAFFTRREGGGFGPVQRIVATGEVFYVTLAEIARGDEGVYDLDAGTVTLTGSVVLTQGCNVSTGERLVAQIDGGAARLSGGNGDDGAGRVRSVFFENPEEEDGAVPEPSECPLPEIPGDGPRPFEPEPDEAGPARDGDEDGEDRGQAGDEPESDPGAGPEDTPDDETGSAPAGPPEDDGPEDDARG
jgi:lipopolysaccharide export system protein LptA